ncbi:nitrogen fixation protein NifQ [soil metagenome]
MRVAPDRLYNHLCWFGTAAGTDLFDMHITASILAIAAHDSGRKGCSLADTAGLGGRELRHLFMILFPDALGQIDGMDLPDVVVDDEESQLRDILFMNSAEASPFERLLAHMVARRCLEPNHLWQDLGLGNRTELSKLMRRHFPRLAERNDRDMKWKKFFYRMMCSSTGYALCVAPVCSECDDFDQCFGAEDGETLVARIGNGRIGNTQEIPA